MEFESFRIPWVHIGEVQIEKLIRLAEGLKLHDGAVDTCGGGLFPCGYVQHIVAAQCAAVDTVAYAPRRSTVVAEIRHALRERLKIKRNLMAVALVEHLRMMRPASRLDHGQRGIGALGRGEVLIENCTARKEARDVRHVVRKARPRHIPRQSVDEEVQHELFACGAVPEADRRAHGVERIPLRREMCRLREAKMAERPFAEIGRCGRRGCRLHRQLLQILRPCNGNNDLRPLRYLDGHRAAHLLRTLQLKGEVALHLVNEDRRVAHLLNECALVREKGVLHVGGNPVARLSCGRRQRQMLTDKGIEVEPQPNLIENGAALRHGGTRAKPCGDGEAIQPLRSAACDQLYGDL